MKKLKKSLLAISLLCASQQSSAGMLTIEINDLGGISDSQYTLFENAKDRWGEFLTGIQSSFDLLLSVDASGVDIDGAYGTLGRAAPTRAEVDNVLGYAYASEGMMEFDTADLNRMESDGTLMDVIFHELGHVLGFGTLWNTDSYGGVFAGTQSVYEAGTGEYTGEYALAEYRDEFDFDALFVPVELDGGEGTADGHWDEQWAGGSSDIMTGYLDSSLTISNTTIASFADLGYLTTVTHSIESDEPSSVEVSAPATFGIFSLGLFALMRRRSQQK